MNYLRNIFKKISKNKGLNLKSGFTLVEMMVVIAIVVIITSIILGSYPLFASQVSLASIAREIALGYRQAQVFGLAVREFPYETNVYPPYGINITPIVRSPFSIVLFADVCDSNGNCDSSLEVEDKNGNGLYDGCGDIDPDVNECISETIIERDAELLDVCVTDTGGDEHCWDGGLGDLTTLNVTFKRPDPEAVIKINDDEVTHYVSSRITIRSKRYPDRAKSIRVWVTGQISTIDYEITE